MSINREISVTGHLGRDPESQYTPKGKLVCKFSIATTKGWGDNQETEWIDVVAWEKIADTLQKNLEKGSKIQVRGDFEVQAWIGKDEEAHGKVVVTVREFQFLSRRKAQSEPEEDEPEFMRE